MPQVKYCQNTKIIGQESADTNELYDADYIIADPNAVHPWYPVGNQIKLIKLL